MSRPLTRRALLAGLLAGAASLAAPRRAAAFGETSAFDLPLIAYDAPGWNPRPTAIRRLLLEIEVATSIEVVSNPSTTSLEIDNLFGSPAAVLCGDRGFSPWSAAQRNAVGAWLRAGGLLLVDSQEGRSDGGFAESVRRELAAIVPGTELAAVPDDHVLYRSFYLVDPAPGRLRASSVVEGLTLDDRLAVIVSHNDLLGAWARDDVGAYTYEVSGGFDAREMAMRFGVNIAMYATCLDYKADQVHVEYLMRRRRWQVP